MPFIRLWLSICVRGSATIEWPLSEPERGLVSEGWLLAGGSDVMRQPLKKETPANRIGGRGEARAPLSRNSSTKKK